MQTRNEYIKLFLGRVIEERKLQARAVLMEQLLQTACNSIPLDRHVHFFTKTPRPVLRLTQTLI